MQLLITGGDSAVARLAAEHLRQFFRVRVVDNRFTTPFPGDVEALTGDLREEAFVSTALTGVESVLHLAPLSLTLGDDAANLEHATRGTYQLAQAVRKAGLNRLILGSSMTLFASVQTPYPIRESWRPRPQASVSDLCAYLAECALRDIARQDDLPVVCVRFGAADASALTAIHRALAARCDGWRILHAVERVPSIPTTQYHPIPSRPIKNVLILGAGGPMAAVVARELAPHYRLRLTDVKPMAEIVAAGPRKDQHPGAPMVAVLGAPHDEMVVDVTNAAQVMAACEGMDAIINCTVIRHHMINSYRVNAMGAYHVMQAAVAHGIRRVVHTGPFQIGMQGPSGYNWDDFIVEDVPARPGHYMNTYLHTKYLGQEICRVFAENHDLEVPALLFCDFADFVNRRANDAYVHPFTVTWEDTGRAIRAALEAPTLPSPFEILHINADLPQGVFPNSKAKRLLNWQPQDAPESWWLTQ